MNLMDQQFVRRVVAAGINAHEIEQHGQPTAVTEPPAPTAPEPEAPVKAEKTKKSK